MAMPQEMVDAEVAAFAAQIEMFEDVQAVKHHLGMVTLNMDTDVGPYLEGYLAGQAIDAEKRALQLTILQGEKAMLHSIADRSAGFALAPQVTVRSALGAMDGLMRTYPMLTGYIFDGWTPISDNPDWVRKFVPSGPLSHFGRVHELVIMEALRRAERGEPGYDSYDDMMAPFQQG